MSRRNQFMMLGVLFAVLLGSLYYAYRNFASPDDAPKTVAVDDRFTPVSVDNPALRTDILKRFLELEYKGVHRSIFSATLPPPPVPPSPPKPVNVAPPVPPGP